MKRLVAGAIASLAVVGIVGCASAQSSSSGSTKNRDPYGGWVAKFDTGPTDSYASRIWYRCDEHGTGFYVQYANSGGVDVVLDSPDCKSR